MRKISGLALMFIGVLIVCSAALAEKTKKTTKTTTQKGPKTVWLTSLEPTSKKGIYWPAEYNNEVVGGVIYDRTPMIDCTYGAWLLYDLQKKYDKFETLVGIPDKEQHSSPIDISIYGDGELLESVSVNHGTAQPVYTSVKNIRALKIECNGSGVLVLADPKLIIGVPAPKKETTTTATTKTSTSTETMEVTESACDGSTSVSIDSKALETLANNLAAQATDAGLTKNGKVQLAVTKFKLVSICKKSVADDVLDDLSTYLLKTKVFKLIEREQLEKAIKELKFNLTGFIEPKKAIELGKMTGASAILIGSVSDRGSTVMVNARIINTKTGEADIAENVEMKK